MLCVWCVHYVKEINVLFEKAREEHRAKARAFTGSPGDRLRKMKTGSLRSQRWAVLHANTLGVKSLGNRFLRPELHDEKTFK